MGGDYERATEEDGACKSACQSITIAFWHRDPVEEEALVLSEFFLGITSD